MGYSFSRRRGLRRPMPGSLVVLICILLCHRAAMAQQTTIFEVSVQGKNETHPFYQEGHYMGYAIDGIQGKELTLIRGKHYTFRMQDVPGEHPFYISTSVVGAGRAPLESERIANPFISGNDALYFEPDATIPGLLYYQCGNHEWMGGKINVVDGPVGAVESELATAAVSISPASPNPCRNRSAFTLMVRAPQRVRVTLHDITGHQVALLHDGTLTPDAPRTLAIDAASLAPGVYFYRVTGSTFTLGRSIVVIE